MKKNFGMLALIMAFWFTISFITNILGPLIPDIIHNFNLSDLAMAGFIPTSFFIAYAIMSVPAGLMIDRFGEKPVLFLGFLMPFIGTTLFACLHTYPMLLASSFIIGLGMAMLQTVLNPLQRVVGGEENYAFVAEVAQFVFGIASFLSPLVYTYLIHELNPDIYTEGRNFFIDLLAGITPPDLPWVSLYWVFTLLLLVMLVAVGLSRFPKIELKEDEKGGSKDSYLALFRQKYVWLFFLGIFCYVSTEQGTSIFMSTFLEQYHGVNPQVEGAKAVSYFWGLMTAGCLVGMVLLKLIHHCFPCHRFQHFHDVLHRVLAGAEFGIATPRFVCRYPVFGNRGRSRRPDDYQHACRCHFAAYRNADYPRVCRLHHIHRFLGAPAD